MSCDFTSTNLTSACCNNLLAFFRPRLIWLVCVAGHALQHHAVVSEALVVSALVGGHFIPVVLFVFAAVLAGEAGFHAAISKFSIAGPSRSVSCLRRSTNDTASFFNPSCIKPMCSLPEAQRSSRRVCRMMFFCSVPFG